MFEAQDVEGVSLAAPARGGGRARLHDERGVAAYAVTLCRVPRVTDVQMTREQHVRAAGGERLHRELRAPDKFALVVSDGHVERVMRDDDLRDLFTEGAEPLAYARDLHAVDA